MNKGHARKLSSSGIELVREFLSRTMCNHNQFLLLISYSCSLFGELAEVLILTGKSDAYNRLICIVECVHMSTCPSQCQKLDRIFFAILCAEICCSSFRQGCKAINIVFVCFFIIVKCYTGKIN